MNAFEAILKALAASLEPIAAETLMDSEKAAIFLLNSAVQNLINKMPKTK